MTIKTLTVLIYLSTTTSYTSEMSTPRRGAKVFT